MLPCAQGSAWPRAAGAQRPWALETEPGRGRRSAPWGRGLEWAEGILFPQTLTRGDPTVWGRNRSISLKRTKGCTKR